MLVGVGEAPRITRAISQGSEEEGQQEEETVEEEVSYDEGDAV